MIPKELGDNLEKVILSRTNQLALHSCHYRACCELTHLRAGSNKDNAADRVLAGRNHDKTGSKHHLAKLNESKVKFIKRLLSEGIYLSRIARMFSVSISCISAIRTGRNWSHV